MRTLFNATDTDGDGLITQRDYELRAERWAEVGQLNEQQTKRVKDLFQKAYRDDVDIEGGPVTFEQFFETSKKFSKAYFQERGELLYPSFFPVIDTDGDGLIDEREFTLSFKVIGLKEQDAKEAFQHLDTNQDGKIDKNEFCQAGLDFFTIRTEGHPSQYMFGPLAE